MISNPNDKVTSSRAAAWDRQATAVAFAEGREEIVADYVPDAQAWRRLVP
jgi:hypothetical protein